MFWAREIEHNDLLIWLYFLSCHFEFISKFANAAAIAATPGTSRHSFFFIVHDMPHLDLNNKYRQVSYIGRTLAGYKIVDQLHIHSRLNTFIGLGKDNCTTRRETIKFGDFGASYVRDLTVSNIWYIIVGVWILSFSIVQTKAIGFHGIHTFTTIKMMPITTAPIRMKVKRTCQIIEPCDTKRKFQWLGANRFDPDLYSMSIPEIFGIRYTRHLIHNSKIFKHIFHVVFCGVQIDEHIFHILRNIYLLKI